MKNAVCCLRDRFFHKKRNCHSQDASRPRRKPSFFRQSSRFFLCLIVLPTLFCWLCYTLSLNIHHMLRNLDSQQAGLHNQMEQASHTLKGINDGVVHLLESNSELYYYLSGLYDGPEMVYAALKSILPLKDNVISCYPDVEQFHIYTSADVVPLKFFFSLDSLPLEENAKNQLLSSDFRQVIWHVEVSPQGVPILSSYQKIYNSTYARCIGYLEIRYQESFFTRMADSLSSMLFYQDAGFACFHEGNKLSSSSDVPPSVSAPEGPDGLYVDWSLDSYRNVVTLEDCGLQMVFTGRLSQTLFQIYDLFPFLMVTALILLLLLCSSLFFRIVRHTSEKLFAFSSFLNRTSESGLEEYPAAQERFAEIHTLINSFNALVRKNHALNQRMLRMEALTQEARYQALQSQIHPHFIYGTLETIRMLALANQDTDAASMIYSLSSLMRQSVEISSQASTLKRELSIVQDYMDIQQIRFSGHLNYEVHTCPEWDALSLPPFTLQPIVENAIVYGISQSLEPGRILLRIWRPDRTQDLCIRISNTGKTVKEERLHQVNAILSGEPVPEELHPQGNGIALYNIVQRLRFLYPERVQMEMETDQRWTHVTILIRDGA